MLSSKISELVLDLGDARDAAGPMPVFFGKGSRGASASEADEEERRGLCEDLSDVFGENLDTGTGGSSESDLGSFWL